MARMAKGHDGFTRMTGESPTPLIDWLKLNQMAIDGDGTFQSSQAGECKISGGIMDKKTPES